MKYLDYPELEALSRALTFESVECKVFTRLEAYSCKAVNKEKRLFKALESAYHQSASTSPPDYLEEVLASPFGRLDQPGARKTLFLLIALLNGAFPDHDFSQVKPADFRKEPNAQSVLHSLSSTLFSLRENNGGLRSYSTFSGSFDQHVQGYMHASTSLPSAGDAARPFTGFGGATHAGLASLLDDIMDVGDCEVFTFHPDADSDPHACAEPDEVGFDDDCDYWSDDGDISMQSVNVATPRGGSEELDTPMFDEEFDGGFAGRSVTGATDESDGPHTPKTPSATAGRSGDVFASGGKGVRKSIVSHPQTAYYPSSSLSSGGSHDMDDDDDDDDGAGSLLWSTYAFFYNRRLKRMLFVSVWSRTNTGGGSWSSPHTSFEPILSLPPSLKLPCSVTSPKLRPTQPQKMPSAKSTNAGSKPVKVSPAKVAINKTTRGRSSMGSTGQGGGIGPIRRRAASGSPAPSSLSPFPHASPRSAGKQVPDSSAPASHSTRGAPSLAGRGSQLRATRGSSNLPPMLSSSSDGSDRVSLDAAALSISAPTAGGASAPKRSATTGAGDGAQTATNAEGRGVPKRTRRQVAT